jgi:hypothetical protein
MSSNPNPLLIVFLTGASPTIWQSKQTRRRYPIIDCSFPPIDNLECNQSHHQSHRRTTQVVFFRATPRDLLARRAVTLLVLDENRARAEPR